MQFMCDANLPIFLDPFLLQNITDVCRKIFFSMDEMKRHLENVHHISARPKCGIRLKSANEKDNHLGG